MIIPALYGIFKRIWRCFACKIAKLWLMYVFWHVACSKCRLLSEQITIFCYYSLTPETVSYSFTPPSVSPATKYCCRNG